MPGGWICPTHATASPSCAAAQVSLVFCTKWSMLQHEMSCATALSLLFFFKTWKFYFSSKCSKHFLLVSFSIFLQELVWIFILARDSIRMTSILHFSSFPSYSFLISGFMLNLLKIASFGSFFLFVPEKETKTLQFNLNDYN